MKQEKGEMLQYIIVYSFIYFCFMAVLSALLRDPVTQILVFNSLLHCINKSTHRVWTQHSNQPSLFVFADKLTLQCFIHIAQKN